MIESILHFLGLCSDGHTHFKISDLFFSMNEVRDKLNYIKYFFIGKKEKTK
jgi:hypothetical protein